ncbi:MAG: hypothetical protein AAB110_00115 [Candidatus Desantisbacteria bacterium]
MRRVGNAHPTHKIKCHEVVVRELGSEKWVQAGILACLILGHTKASKDACPTTKNCWNNLLYLTGA